MLNVDNDDRKESTTFFIPNILLILGLAGGFGLNCESLHRILSVSMVVLVLAEISDNGDSKVRRGLSNLK